MPCLILLIVQSSSSIICVILKFSKDILAYFQMSPPTSQFPPNSSSHQGALGAGNKARGGEALLGVIWALAGQWLGGGTHMIGLGVASKQTWELVGIRWSLTSVPIFGDFPPPALGSAPSAQFPGPQRKARFHRRNPNLTQGKACWVYL